MVRFDQKLRPGLSSGVGVGRLQHMVLLHGFRFECLPLPVDFIGRHVDKSPEPLVVLSRLEKHMRSQNVSLGKVERVAERVVDVSLSSKVHDGVNPFLCQNIGNEIGATDIALDEFEVFETRYFLEISEA